MAIQSSLDNPLAYFEYLFTNNGIEDLKKEFIPTKWDYENAPNLNYDTEKEIISWTDLESSGEYVLYTKSFTEHLTKILNREYENSCKLIHTSIINKPTQTNACLYINVLFGILNYLLIEINNNRTYEKYPQTFTAIKYFVFFIYKKYNLFNPLIPSDIQKAFPELLITNENQEPENLKSVDEDIFAFKWLYPLEKTYRLNTLLLYSLNKGFICKSTTEEQISKAFSGDKLDNRLNIKWIENGKGQSINKYALFYLLEKLSTEGLIEPITFNINTYRRINYIFCDKYLNQINNMAQSYWKYKKAPKNTSKYTLLDSIIIELKADDILS